MNADAREQVIREEQKAFDAQLPDLAAAHPGEYVVFKGGEAISFHGTFQAAFDAGLALYGLDEPYLVGHAVVRPPRPVSLAWDLGVMFR